MGGFHDGDLFENIIGKRRHAALFQVDIEKQDFLHGGEPTLRSVAHFEVEMQALAVVVE